MKEPLASTTTAQNKSFPSALKLYYKEDRACGRDPKIMMQDMRIALSLQQLSIKLKGGNQAAIAPPPHPSTAMRLSKEPFREVPLTPSKVRAEQGQRAECKHFKRHFGKTKAILDPRQAERAHVKWDKLYFWRKARTQKDRKTHQMSLNIGHTHTHRRIIQWKSSAGHWYSTHPHTAWWESGLVSVCLPALRSSMHTI